MNDAWQQEMRSAAANNPTNAALGCCMYERVSETCVFLWFNTPTEFHRCVAQVLPGLISDPDDGREEGREYERCRTAIEKLAIPDRAAATGWELYAEQVSDILVDLTCEWIGTFEELRSGSAPWPSTLRTSFRSHDAEDRSEPISEHELADFVAYIAEYGN